MVSQSPVRLTAADYYALPEYAQHDLIQLIDGEVILGVPPTPRHQRIVREILLLLTNISRNKGGEAFSSPIEVYLDAHNIFEPDVLYLAAESACKIEEKRLVGAPDLVVEVLSPGTARFDRQQKYQAYERHGVREYWIADPVYDVLEVWRWREGQFVRQGAYAPGDSFESQTLGETIAVGPIFSA